MEAALLRWAIGYEVTEAEGEPNVTAQIFWLKNRRPKASREAHHLHQIFDPSDGTGGITPEDEAEVAALVSQVLGGPAVVPQGPGELVEAPGDP